MKFFHLSDLHLGKHLHHYNLKEDQTHILEEIVEYARQLRPDAVLIAGDIYDKSVPAAEAVTVFDEFLTNLAKIKPSIPILMLGGNHDSGERLDYVRELLHHHQIYIAGRPPMKPEEYLTKVTLEDDFGPVYFYLLPFLKPSHVRGVFPEKVPEDYTEAVDQLIRREAPDYKQRNVLLSHQFYTGKGEVPATCDSEIYVGGLDNVDIFPVKDFDYVALGHLHGAQQVGKPKVRYCGTPLKYSVSEAAHQKGLTVVTLEEKGEPARIEVLPLHPLRDVKKKVGKLADILEEGRQGDGAHYVSVTLIDEEELYKPREQLDLVYPYLLEVRIDNQRTRSRLEDLAEIEERKSPLEMYQDFYREVHGTPLSADGEYILAQLLAGMKEGE